MTVKELKQHHKNIAEAGKAGNCLNAATHSYLSIEFAISILEEICIRYKEDINENISNLTEWGLGYRGCSMDTIVGLQAIIEELKQQLEKL